MIKIALVQGVNLPCPGVNLDVRGSFNTCPGDQTCCPGGQKSFCPGGKSQNNVISSTPMYNFFLEEPKRRLYFGHILFDYFSLI